MSILSPSFYQRPDVVAIAKDLLGKWLLTSLPGNEVTAGIIIETEAYAGPEDRASHAHGMRRTKRTEVMYENGGIAYVYLCYGIHHLLNVVTNSSDIPHAVLIRALLPTSGIQIMMKRRGKKESSLQLTGGPGALCQALGIDISHNGVPFDSPILRIEDHNHPVDINQIEVSPRIGIDYAGPDALLPWRFRLKPSLLEKIEAVCV